MLEFLVHNTVFALFLLLSIAIGLGSLSWRGISFGMTAVLFVALVFGHFGVKIPKEVTELGLALFVYAIGLQAGPGFFKALKENGKNLALLCAIGTIISGLATIIAAKLFTIPADIATGLFAGSNTNTPILAAATEFASKLGFNPTNISVGYGVAYPFSIIIVVLSLQILPSIFKKRATIAEEEFYKQQKRKPLLIKHFRVINPACFGKKAIDIHPHDFGKVNISRVLRNGKFIPATANTRFQENDIVTAVGFSDSINRIGLIFGKEEEIPLEDEAYNVIGNDINVFSSKFIGKTLKELRIWETYNVVLTRIKKNEYELFPHGSYELEYGDIIHAVGHREDIAKFTRVVSDVDAKTNETNFLSFFLGLAAGILIGLLPFSIFGLEMKLGMSTGVFFVSLIIGYYGKIGSLKIYIPHAASNLSRDLGLMLFLAGAGTSAGATLLHVIQSQGANIFFATIMISLLTISIPLTVMLLYRKIDFYSALGTFGGFMADLSALIAAKNKINIDIAMLSYATSYPFALIFKVIFVQLLMIILEYITRISL